MSVLENVLIEEKQRIEKNINAYFAMLAKLPKGSIVIRYVGHHQFVYRNVRMKNKIQSIYLGKKESIKVKEQIRIRNDYMRIKENIKKAKSEYLKIIKALKAFD
jgi:23S rRNA A2030 N6-methylase RlmJ